ncbi:MAG: VWA domain-containing protein [Bryobacteraceae bacterium]
MTAGYNSFRLAMALCAASVACAESAGRVPGLVGGSVFPAESRLILVPVTVVDRNGASVLNLRQDQFRVFDNAEQLPIVSFSREEAPVMLGVVLDLSGSMKSKIPHALEAVRAITNFAEQVDQGFLITFADRPELRVDVTSNLKALANPWQLPTARGGTALVDAAFDALQKTRSTRHNRRALLIVSDGGDNSSRRGETELTALAREAETQVYSISIQERSANKEERRGYYILHDLSKRTGGLHFLVRDRRELPEIAEKIAIAMRNTYVIGYKPPPNLEPGKWRNIRVALAGAGKSHRLSAKNGYYVPE